MGTARRMELKFSKSARGLRGPQLLSWGRDKGKSEEITYPDYQIGVSAKIPERLLRLMRNFQSVGRRRVKGISGFKEVPRLQICVSNPPKVVASLAQIRLGIYPW